MLSKPSAKICVFLFFFFLEGGKRGVEIRSYIYELNMQKKKPYKVLQIRFPQHEMLLRGAYRQFMKVVASGPNVAHRSSYIFHRNYIFFPHVVTSECHHSC